MTKVLYMPEVVDQFLELAEVLYADGYLSLKEVAIEYAESLFRDIQRHLPNKLRRNAPEYFKQYGKGLFYSIFPKNRHTTWYVFYSIHTIGDDTIYLVRYIGNNHLVANHLN